MRKFITLVVLLAIFSTSAVFAGEKVKISLICKAMDSEWWKSVKAGGEEFAKQHPDLELSVLAPDREINIQQQLSIIEDQIANGTDCLVIAPCGAAEVVPMLDKAYAANVPVVIFDTDADWEYKKAYVGANNYNGGKLAGEYIVEKLSTNGGTVALITGVMGHQTHIDRVQGAIDQIKKNPNIKIVSQQPANSERALGMTVMENILTTYPEVDFVFATNDEMALGASQAVQAVKAKAGVIGFDGTTEARNSIKDGEMVGTVDGNAKGLGFISVETGYKVAKGEAVNPIVPVLQVLITPENVNK